MMAKNNADAYSKSSFDAIESTRRLSDELTRNESSVRHSSKRNCADDLDQEVECNDENVTIGSFTRLDKGTTGFSSRKQSSGSMSNGVDGFTSSSLGSIARDSNTDLNEEKLQSDRITEYEEDEEGEEVDDGEDEIPNSVNKFDQRSESDSDLESPDDFDENTYRGNGARVSSNDIGLDKQLCEKSVDSENEIHNKAHQQTSFSHTNYSQNAQNNSYVNAHPNYQSTLSQQYYSRTKDTNDLPGNRHGKSDSGDSEAEGKDKQHQQDIQHKINDEDVVNDSETLDSVRDIGLGNMNQLQHLDRNDPAIRRLFMRPRVSPGETKSVKVDPDIKSMVNEFLRTNVTENFIIARVLRENYALFYSWLATHMQTERNSWAVRLSQALDNADQERKGYLECKTLVVEAATRIRTLAKTVNSSLYDGPDHCTEYNNNSNIMHKRGPSLRQGTVKSFRSTKAGGGACRKLNDIKETHSNISSSNTQNNIILDNVVKYSDNNASSILRQSSFNVIEVSELTHYESDPGTGQNTYDVRKRPKKTININVKNSNDNLFLKQAGCVWENSKLISRTNIDTGDNNNNNSMEADSMPFGYTINGIVVDYDDEIDWKQVLTQSIDILVEICDTFLTDRKACLSLISSKSNHFGSLVDVLSTFIQDSKSQDNRKRQEVDKKLQRLEKENEMLQEEMVRLKKTLLDKSEDAHYLQTHFNLLESAVKSNKAEKVDKCVGTRHDDVLSPIVLNGGNKQNKASKSKHSNHQRGEIAKANQTAISHKLSKSPYAAKDSSMANGSSSKIMSHHYHRNGYGTDASESYHTTDTSGANTIKPSNIDTLPEVNQRQQSFIEISEEKLEKLKLRAKKLENSLHDAISSMDTLNKSTPWLDKVHSSNDNKILPVTHIQRVKAAGNHHLTAKSIAYWKKSSFEVTTSPMLNRQGFAGVKNNNMIEINKKAKETTPTEIEWTLKSEPSSLLEGRSIAVPAIDTNDAAYGPNAVSHLKLVQDRSQGLTPGSPYYHVDGYNSDDEDRKSLYRQRQQQNDSSNKNELSARSEVSQKVRARRGQVKQLVSKCLRCQKLFSPTDNHKLACCYHSKDKERLEQYDHMGMLVKVIYAWKCCNQTQEADGCCFGKHV